jgi:AcrR family transcriptional regulator
MRIEGRRRRVARKKAAGPTVPLSRERIVDAALELVDREGLDALSMRRLGAELGVDPMAIYYHVPNKDALFDLLVEAVMADIDLSDDPSAPARVRLVCAAKSYRAALLRHINAFPVLADRAPRTPVSMKPVDVLLGILMDGGLSPSDAVVAMNVVVACVRGAVGVQASHELKPEHHQDISDEDAAALAPADFPHLHAAFADTPELDFDAWFDYGMRALAQGLFAEER